MKKPILYWFGFILFLLAISYFASCSRKIVKQTEATTEKIVEKIVDSSQSILLKEKSIELQKTQASVDSLKFAIGLIRTGNKDCDSVCNIQVKQMLSAINLNRKSGNNTSGIYYDKAKDLLVLYNKQGESINLITKQKDSLKTVLYHLENKQLDNTYLSTKDIPVPFVPLVYKIFALIGLTTAIFLGFKLFFFIKSKSIV